jgi:DNA (cytosine-5)-methyltransferase 1
LKTIKFIDLFAGMGGMRIGFEKAMSNNGIKTDCILTSEIKQSAIDLLKSNFNHKILNNDVTKINEKELPDFDFLLGGFPCQAFSAAGNKDGFCDTRGTLFFDIERILKEKRPEGFLLENVEGLVKHDIENKKDEIGKTLTTILLSLTNLGYKVSWKVLNSKDFGIPQSRKRIYIVGSLNKKINLNKMPIYKNKVFGDIQEEGLETLETDFTKKILKFFKPKDLYGKSIKDKRCGINNIHSWDIELKGKINKEEKKLLSLLLKERRKKHWAEKIGINWMDGMPLTLSQIETFYTHIDLQKMLLNLISIGYLKLEHPRDLVNIKKENGSNIIRREPDITKAKGYNIVTGKLSFEFSNILDKEGISNTLVASDFQKNAVIDNNKIRTLSLREGLRLFGYPEWYSLEIYNKDTKSIRKAYDLLGNTVAVTVIEEVSNAIAKVLK